jgi:hypothetical protein
MFSMGPKSYCLTRDLKRQAKASLSKRYYLKKFLNGMRLIRQPMCKFGLMAYGIPIRSLSVWDKGGAHGLMGEGSKLKSPSQMSMKLSIAPMNSLLFLSDPDGGEAPIPVWGAQILSTHSCISFACYPEQDGETEISLGARRELDPGTPPVFEGELETPHHAVIVSTVDQKTIMRMDVPGNRTHVCIWLSHPRWPKEIIIGLG